MSFLNNEDSKFLSVRITKKGRNSIAKGNFKISYFQVGDSEYDYTSPFDELTGLSNIPSQIVFAPFDKESGVKYPYKIDSSEDGTTYGVPVQNSGIPERIRNVMGTAGYVSKYIEYDGTSGSTIEYPNFEINVSALSGTNTITAPSGSGTTFAGCSYITVALTSLNSSGGLISGNSISYQYKISGVSSNTIYLDRQTPNLSAVSGKARVICNYYEPEYSACQTSVDYKGQLNPWSLNVVWGGNPVSVNFGKPIGSDVTSLDESISGYSSNVHVSTKELLGYTSTGQTFVDYTGLTVEYPTSYVNSFDEEILVPPMEQRCIAILHYSELGDVTIDPERFYKYDDYLSYDNTTTNTVAFDTNNEPISDTDYFQVFIPFIYYHRNSSSVPGALFYMGYDDFYIKSTKNTSHQLLYRYLYDEQGIKVGKVFPNNKTIVFDDQELVAMLDYRSNRKYTLPSPKVIPIPSGDSAQNSLLSGGTNQVVWVTYMLSYTTDKRLNGLPCNYYMKVKLPGTTDTCSLSTPCNISIKFNSNDFSYLKTSINNISTGFIANRFYALLQVLDEGEYPEPNDWKYIDLTSIISGHTVGNLINPDNLVATTFNVTYDDYENNSSSFDLENFLVASSTDTNYLGDTLSGTTFQFGDSQYFPGSIKVVRATDIEEMRFLVNLSSTEFMETQNPTYYSGSTKKVTDIALLDDNKDVMVIAKTSKPVTRTGTQVFTIKLDF
jgi:hypothetical protein